MSIGSVDPLFVKDILAGFSVTGVITLIGFVLEWRGGKATQRIRSVVFNLAYSLPASLLQSLLKPMGAAATVLIVSAAGGGLIPLPSTGWLFLPSVLVYLLAMDCGEYLFHRAQHRVAFLWAMHSFHHSDPDLNISTTYRHFWLEQLLKSLTVYLAVGLIFKVDAAVAGAYALITCYNYFVHLNVRIGFGRFWWLANSPQFHRIHHSRLARDHDCNFAGMLTIFDYLFGTYRVPAPGEYPPTGLDTGLVPAGILAALAWPLHSLPAFRLSRPAAH